MTVPVVWSTAPAVDPGLLTTLAQACSDEERLRFAYTAQGGERTSRHVEPHRLVSLGRRWYLVAYDLARQDWRSFRLDRLENPRSTGMRFRPRELPASDAAAFVRAGIDNLPAAPKRIEALVYAPAAAVRTIIGQWATVEHVDERRCRLRMRAESLDWPALALGSVGAEFEVLHPPELVEHIREWGARFTRATTQSCQSERSDPSAVPCD
jgi:predicted DNA-binding transcriptional regulator YafY